MDAVQSASGLALALFMWAHMFMVSSILISPEAMHLVTRLFEGYFFFGRSYPVIVSIVASGILALMMLHALLALRKFPQDSGQYARFLSHRQRMAHDDTSFWWWQVVTGFLLFFMAPAHLYTMISQPDQIGPYASSWRVYSSHWPLYLIMLFVVELHAAIGLYRLALKWGWFGSGDARVIRRRLRITKWLLSAFFILLGLFTLAAYYELGETLKDTPGIRYPAGVAG